MPTAFTQYLGYDVLEIEPSWDEPVSRNTRNVYRLDPGMGKVSVSDRSGVPVMDRKGFRWVMDGGRADIQVFRDFISNRAGMRVPFWVPTWRKDMALTADLPVGNAGMIIQGIGFTKYMYGANCRHYLAFIMPDRTKSYRHITASADPGNGTESITLDSAFAFTLPAASVMISFLTLCRLADDKPRLLWHTPNLAESTLEFVELPQEVPA